MSRWYTPYSLPPSEPAATPFEELHRTAELQRVEGEQRTFRARELVQQADEARAANRLDEALTLYAQAAELDPTNTQAAEGRAALLSRWPELAPDAAARSAAS